MSWYNQKVNELMENIPSEPQATHIPSGVLYQKYGKEIAMSLTITDINSEADKEVLMKAIYSLPGVTSVKTILQQKKLIISYNTGKINLETILYHIARLGYHYIQRS